MAEDALWYEAAMVVGITHALNVVADAFGGATTDLVARPPATGGEQPQPLFADIRAFYARSGVPLPFRLMARDPAYARDVWDAVTRAFIDNRLTTALKG